LKSFFRVQEEIDFLEKKVLVKNKFDKL